RRPAPAPVLVARFHRRDLAPTVGGRPRRLPERADRGAGPELPLAVQPGGGRVGPRPIRTPDPLRPAGRPPNRAARAFARYPVWRWGRLTGHPLPRPGFRRKRRKRGAPAGPRRPGPSPGSRPGSPRGASARRPRRRPGRGEMTLVVGQSWG